MNLKDLKGGNMKPKKFSKKLTLNKKTVAHLNGNEMTKVKGGIPTFPYPGCPYPVPMGTTRLPWAYCCQSEPEC